MTPATTYDRKPPTSEPSSSQELLSIARELMATVCNTMITEYGNMVDNSLPLLCYFSPVPETFGDYISKFSQFGGYISKFGQINLNPVTKYSQILTICRDLTKFRNIVTKSFGHWKDVLLCLLMVGGKQNCFLFAPSGFLLRQADDSVILVHEMSQRKWYLPALYLK